MAKRRRSSPTTPSPRAAERTAAVEQIYRNDAGAIPDLTRFDRRRPTWHRWAIGGGLVTLALLAVAAWAGFLIFKPYNTSVGGNITFTVDAPTNARIGSEVVYRVHIANDDRVPVAQTTIEIRLPTDFSLITSDPAPDDTRELRWTIGTVPARGERWIELRGRIYGSPNASARVDATAFYRPANFNSDFQALASATTTLDASPLTIGITGPTEAVPGERATYTITYENTGETSTPAAVVTLAIPPSFTIVETTPKRSKPEELLWTIGEIPPQTKNTITAIGTFTDTAKGTLEVGTTIALVPIADRRLPQADARATTRVFGGDVVVIATVNDQNAGIDARPGDALQFRIALRNDGDAELRDLTIRAVFDATAMGERSILDFNKLADPANGTAIGEQITPTVRRGTMTWTSTNLPALASLKSTEQQMLTFALPIRTSDTPLPAGAKATMVAEVDVQATGTTEKPRTVRSAPIEIRVR